MENMQPQENISEQNLQKPIEQEQVEKEKEVKKKKHVFLALFTIVGAATLSVILLLGGFSVYKKYLASRVQVVAPVQEPEAPQSTEAITYPVEKTIKYKSDNLKISLVYPKDARLADSTEGDEQTKKLEIYFSKDASITDGSGAISDLAISDGYIFRVSTFATTVRNLDEIAKVKKESIIGTCPETSEFSETFPTTIDGIESRVFEVKNCRGDFSITYTPKFGVYYAFEQIYKGDIGYKQIQKAATQEILGSIRFYPEEAGPEQPYETFTNENPKFSFEHPKFDGSCCDIQGPPNNIRAQKIITLADKENFVGATNFDGLSVFYYRPSSQAESNFNTFLENQKNTLIDDYAVVRGTTPKLQEMSIKVGDRNAVLLRGYSWRDVDLIYVSVERQGGNYFLIISVKNVTGDKFEAKIDRILSSFKFL